MTPKSVTYIYGDALVTHFVIPCRIIDIPTYISFIFSEDILSSILNTYDVLLHSFPFSKLNDTRDKKECNGSYQM